MQLVFMTQYGPHQIGDRNEIPVEVARKLIDAGIAKEYKGVLKVSQPQPRPKPKRDRL